MLPGLEPISRRHSRHQWSGSAALSSALCGYVMESYRLRGIRIDAGLMEEMSLASEIDDKSHK